MINSIINNERDAVILCNNKGIITHANQACQRVFGYECNEIIGQTIEMLVPDDVKEKHVGLRSDYMEKPSSRQRGERLGLRGQHKSGVVFDVDVMLSPIYSVDDEWNVVVIVRDISDIGKIMTNLRKKLERLENISNVKPND